jgi:hypothetical protein
MICPHGWTLSPRANVHPFVHPQGVNNLFYCLEEWRGEQRISPPRDNFTPRGAKFTPGWQLRSWGTSHPWGSKFAPRGEVKNRSLKSAFANLYIGWNIAWKLVAVRRRLFAVECCVRIDLVRVLCNKEKKTVTGSTVDRGFAYRRDVSDVIFLRLLDYFLALVSVRKWRTSSPDLWPGWPDAFVKKSPKQ